MRLPLKARAYFGGTVTLGIGVVAVAAVRAANVPLGILALLGAAVVVTELFQVSGDESSPDPVDIHQFSFSSAIHIATILVLGPWAGALVGAFGVLVVDHLGRSPWRRVLFNASVFAIATLVSGYVFVLAGGVPGHLRLPQDLPALCALGVAYGVLNSLLVSTIVALTSGARIGPLVTASVRAEVSPKAAEAGLGAAIAVFAMRNAWDVVVLVPLLVAVYQGHARLAQLRRETARALETFANVVDERDRSTFQHSARVAGHVEELALALGLPSTVAARLRWAGRLHDLGKISVDAGALRSTGRLDSAGWVEMRRHPRLSARLLRRFRFAAGEALAVEYHHERFDGDGYYGIESAEQPLAAHFLMVADSFDAMVSDRPYRPARSEEEALREIELNMGTQFHPLVAAAFVALRRGLDPLTVLTPAQREELYAGMTGPGDHTSRMRRLRALPIELLVLGGVVLALSAIGFGLPMVAAAGVGVAACGLAWRYRDLLRARRLGARLHGALPDDLSRSEAFDAVVNTLGATCGIRWAGLVDWEERNLTGSIELVRSTAEGPNELALTSWLIREAESGSELLFAAGSELGCDGVHVAIPLRQENELAAFLVFGFGHVLPRYAELALRSCVADLCRVLGTPARPALAPAAPVVLSAVAGP